MRLLLVNPGAPEGSLYVNPLGIQTLKGYIQSRDESIEVSLFDFNMEGAKRADFIAHIAKHDIVGFSTPLGSLTHLKELLLRDSDVRNILQAKSVILGGSTATAASEELFLLFGKAFSDLYVVKGEGEIPILNFLRYRTGELDLMHVPNLVWMSHDNILVENNCLVDALTDYYEKPAFTKQILDSVRMGGGIIYMEGLRRGCEHNCTFCYAHILRTPGFPLVRYFPPSRILATINDLNAQDIEGLNIEFTDENFIGGTTEEEIIDNLYRALTFAQQLRQANQTLHFGLDTRADSLFNGKDTAETRDHRQRVWGTLVGAGLKYVYVGIETFSPVQRKRYSKNLDDVALRESIKVLRKLGIRFTIGLISFDPLMTFEELKENIAYIERYKILGNISSISKEMRIQKGTPYYEMARRRGLSMSLSQEDLVFYEYSPQDYVDQHVAKISSIMRWFYRLFNESNYRFPDIPAYLETLEGFPSDKKDIKRKLLSIPREVCELELTILKYLISVADTEEVGVVMDTVRTLCSIRTQRFANLLDVATSLPSAGDYSILVKLKGIFSTINRRLDA